MMTAFKIIILISSIILIVAVLSQESKSDGLSGAIGGGAEQLFGKRKSKGYDAVFHKITIFCGIVFFTISLLGAIL